MLCVPSARHLFGTATLASSALSASAELLVLLQIRTLTLLPAPNAENKLYRCTSVFSALNQCGKILLKSFSYLYEVRRTNVFADFFGVFSIFDRNFAKTVPPFSNEYEKSLLSNASERVITPEKP